MATWEDLEKAVRERVEGVALEPHTNQEGQVFIRMTIPSLPGPERYVCEMAYPADLTDEFVQDAAVEIWAASRDMRRQNRASQWKRIVDALTTALGPNAWDSFEQVVSEDGKPIARMVRQSWTIEYLLPEEITDAYIDEAVRYFAEPLPDYSL